MIVQNVDENLRVGVGRDHKEDEGDVHKRDRNCLVKCPVWFNEERLKGVAQEKSDVPDPVVVEQFPREGILIFLLANPDVLKCAELFDHRVALDFSRFDGDRIDEEDKEERPCRDKEIDDSREVRHGRVAYKPHDEHNDDDEERTGDKECHIDLGRHLERI